MAQKTSSTTLFVNGWTYIFFNRPDTQNIEYLKFKKPKETERGLIGTSNGPIIAKEGSIDAITTTGKGDQRSIVLYYIDATPLVREIKLPDAHLDKVDVKSGWITKGPGLTFENEVTAVSRTVDPTSFLCATVRDNRGVVCFSPAGSSGQVTYCHDEAVDDVWKTAMLQFA